MVDILDNANKKPMVGHTGTLGGLCIEVGGLASSHFLAEKMMSLTGHKAGYWVTMITGAALTGTAAIAWRDRSRYPKQDSSPSV